MPDGSDRPAAFALNYRQNVPRPPDAARVACRYGAADSSRMAGSPIGCLPDASIGPRHRFEKFREFSVNNMAGLSSPGLAQACADFLWQQDATLRSLGLERLSVRAGQATVAMIVLPSMVNGIGITHGSAIFTLAETTFSLAANSCNERTVAAHCCISFLQPTRLGDRLIATAKEVTRSGRSGIYDVSVSLENTVVAEFRAHASVMGGAVLPALAPGDGWIGAEPVQQ
jgi:acyl-CoA thioesterase